MGLQGVQLRVRVWRHVRAVHVRVRVRVQVCVCTCVRACVCLRLRDASHLTVEACTAHTVRRAACTAHTVRRAYLYLQLLLVGRLNPYGLRTRATVDCDQAVVCKMIVLSGRLLILRCMRRPPSFSNLRIYDASKLTCKADSLRMQEGSNEIDSGSWGGTEMSIDTIGSHPPIHGARQLRTPPDGLAPPARSGGRWSGVRVGMGRD